jgi:hypothetical protein
MLPCIISGQPHAMRRLHLKVMFLFENLTWFSLSTSIVVQKYTDLVVITTRTTGDP